MAKRRAVTGDHKDNRGNKDHGSGDDDDDAKVARASNDEHASDDDKPNHDDGSDHDDHHDDGHDSRKVTGKTAQQRKLRLRQQQEQRAPKPAILRWRNKIASRVLTLPVMLGLMALTLVASSYLLLNSVSNISDEMRERIELAGERLIYHGVASYRYNPVGKCGGALYLTDKKLRFKSHWANIVSHDLEYDFGNLDGLVVEQALWISGELHVSMRDSPTGEPGKIESFFIYYTDDWNAAIARSGVLDIIHQENARIQAAKAQAKAAAATSSSNDDAGSEFDEHHEHHRDHRQEL